MADGSAKLVRRWMIKGTLTTDGPLHIGSGLHGSDERLKKRKSEQNVKVAKVAKDHRGLPYLPGSTLKGNIRSFARDAGGKALESFVNSVFGTKDAGSADSAGGKAVFFDARVPDDLRVVGGPQNPPPYWDANQLTGIMTSTQINRRTRTVADKKLFHTEFVPKGIKFEARIGGQDTNGEAGFNEIEQLLAVMEGFNDGSITLGSDTGNDWGRMKWSLDDVLVFDSSTAAQLQGTPTDVGYSLLHPVDDITKSNLRSAMANKKLQISVDSIELDITLTFDGNFLVDDPFKAKSEEDKKKDGPRDKDAPRDHEPLLDADGRVLLPSSSFRGAFRSQAERILRTIGGDWAACYPDGTGPRKSCRAVYDHKGVRDLCPACKLFGATGWRSPVGVEDFRPEAGNEGQSFSQEFVAIDRFTGGSSHGAKFDARSCYRPKLKGSISLNRDALKKTGNDDALLGLMALTLRDLKEGDIRFGFGAAKGYGSCTAEVSFDLTDPAGSIGALHELCRLEAQKQKKEAPDAVS